MYRLLQDCAESLIRIDVAITLNGIYAAYLRTHTDNISIIR